MVGGLKIAVVLRDEHFKVVSNEVGYVLNGKVLFCKQIEWRFGHIKCYEEVKILLLRMELADSNDEAWRQVNLKEQLLKFVRE